MMKGEARKHIERGDFVVACCSDSKREMQAIFGIKPDSLYIACIVLAFFAGIFYSRLVLALSPQRIVSQDVILFFLIILRRDTRRMKYTEFVPYQYQVIDK